MSKAAAQWFETAINGALEKAAVENVTFEKVLTKFLLLNLLQILRQTRSQHGFTLSKPS